MHELSLSYTSGCTESYHELDEAAPASFSSLSDPRIRREHRSNRCCVYGLSRWHASCMPGKKSKTMNCNVFRISELFAAKSWLETARENMSFIFHFTVKLKQIVDHRREGNAVSKEQRYITMRDGQRKLRQSTVGWKFLVEFTDGKKQWIALKDLKESNPVDAAEYVAARKLDDEVAFAWWVPYTLRKKDTIIAAVRGRSKRKTHKYGIEVPDSVEHALRLDRENGNTYWQCALQDEMGQIGVAIQILDDAETLPPGYARSTGHIIFDVKMDFRRKARWVLDGHRQPAPETSNYAGVVSRESVRIAFTYAAMLDLPVMAGDIRNAYLQAPLALSSLRDEIAVILHDANGLLAAATQFFLAMRAHPMMPTPSLLFEFESSNSAAMLILDRRYMKVPDSSIRTPCSRESHVWEPIPDRKRS